MDSQLYWDEMKSDMTFVDVVVDKSKSSKLLEIYPELEFISKISLSKASHSEILGTFEVPWDAVKKPYRIDSDDNRYGKLIPYHTLYFSDGYSSYLIDFYINGRSTSLPGSIKFNIHAFRISLISTSKFNFYRIFLINTPSSSDIMLFGTREVIQNIDNEMGRGVIQSISLPCNHIVFDGVQVDIIDVTDLIGNNGYALEVHSSEILDNESILLDFISFFAGQKTIKVGASYFSTDGKRIGWCSQSVVTDKYLRQRCFKPELYCPAGSISYVDSLNSSVDIFLQVYEPYNLRYVLELIWDASTQYTEISIVEYQVAVEALVDAFFTVNSDLDQHMDPKKFIALCGPELEIIKEKLKDEPGQEPIINAIKDAYSMSKSKRLIKFGQEFGVELNGQEKKLINKTSMKLKHGNKIDPNLLRESMFFYCTYVNRLILSLLKMNSYFDYSTGKMKIN